MYKLPPNFIQLGFGFYTDLFFNYQTPSNSIHVITKIQ